ncbi:hypothetical protein [Marinobacter sp.]|uniref:hypothetical protein n=1 Tax=Marinobacter sp. TaxID=50741 RepID=UPI0035653F0D
MKTGRYHKFMTSSELQALYADIAIMHQLDDEMARHTGAILNKEYGLTSKEVHLITHGKLELPSIRRLPKHVVAEASERRRKYLEAREKKQSGGYTLDDLAKKHGCCRETVKQRSIEVRGGIFRTRSKCTRISEAEERELEQDILKHFELERIAGENSITVAEVEFGMSRDQIRQILNGDQALAAKHPEVAARMEKLRHAQELLNSRYSYVNMVKRYGIHRSAIGRRIERMKQRMMDEQMSRRAA